MTTTTVTETRNAYRQIRETVCRALGIDARTFDRRAEQYGKEFADGEPMAAADWLRGAQMYVHEIA